MSGSSNLDGPRYIRNDREPPYVDSLNDYWWVGPAAARYREALAAEAAAIRAALAADRALDEARRALMWAKLDLDCANRSLAEDRKARGRE